MPMHFLYGEELQPVDVLFFGPHPDDVELFAGGLVASQGNAGHSTAIIDCSFGELGSFGNTELRKTEARTASEILGLKFRVNLGLPDAHLSLLDADEEKAAILALVHILRRSLPSMVVYPYGSDRHPDHGPASTLVETALAVSAMKNFSPELGTPHQVLQAIAYPIRVEAPPSFVVDVSPVYEIKKRAVRAFSSQVKPLKPEISDGVRPLVGSHLSLSSLEARDEYTGSLIGVKYGEAFVTRNAVPIGDPLKHFREHLPHPPLFYLR